MNRIPSARNFLSSISSLLGSMGLRSCPFHNQLSIGAWPSVVYAIGDVHGCLDQLLALERTIAADSQSFSGEKLIVTLGDYIDRGPDSAGVIEHLLAPAPAGFNRVFLAGNHEEFMLSAIHGRTDERWLEFGGVETLRSYGVDAALYRASSPKTRHQLLIALIPADHVAFLESLALSLQIDETVFVHAGIRRDVPIKHQDCHDLIWIRNEFLNAPPTDGLLVVHGHTPVEQAELTPGRIGIDTGAFATGRLTAVRLVEGKVPAFFSTGR